MVYVLQPVSSFVKRKVHVRGTIEAKRAARLFLAARKWYCDGCQAQMPFAYTFTHDGRLCIRAAASAELGTYKA